MSKFESIVKQARKILSRKQMSVFVFTKEVTDESMIVRWKLIENPKTSKLEEDLDAWIV